MTTIAPQSPTCPTCPTPRSPDYSGVERIKLIPEPTPADYRQAMAAADEVAEQRLGDYMLLSWYDRDRDFEAPQHVSECHQDSDIPGYVDYGLSHGASLEVNIGEGRFVFFYLKVVM